VITNRPKEQILIEEMPVGSERAIKQDSNRSLLIANDDRTRDTLSIAAVPLNIFIRLEEHKCLTSIVSHIIGEFWQSNAFFITFFSMVIAAILNYWKAFLECPITVSLIIVFLILALNAAWFFTNVRHLLYGNIHIEHAREIEEEIGYSVYTRRLQKISERSWPSTRKVWLSVPIIFSLAIILLEAFKIFPNLFKL
jgi:hypothetical protein